MKVLLNPNQSIANVCLFLVTSLGWQNASLQMESLDCGRYSTQRTWWPSSSSSSSHEYYWSVLQRTASRTLNKVKTAWRKRNRVAVNTGTSQRGTFWCL